MSELLTAKSLSWMLVGRAPTEAPDTEHVPVRTRQVLAAVARRGLPNLIEATVIPTALFLVIAATVGTAAAMASVFVWGFGAIGRRLLMGQRVPAILVLATVGLTVRTTVGLASGSTFAYFIQPVGTTVALAGIFAGAGITVAAIVVTVVWALRTVKREQLVFAMA